MIRVGQGLFTRVVGITPTRNKNLSRTRNRTDLLGKIFPVVNAGKARENSSIPHDQPRASSPINDNQCVIQLQAGLLAGSSTEETMNNFSNVELNVVYPVHTAPGHSQKNEISPGAAVCHYKRNRLKFVKGVSCVIPLSSVKPAINAPNVVTNPPVGARLQNFWKNWLDLGAGPKVVQILKEGYALPFRIRPYLTYGQKCNRAGTQTQFTRVFQQTVFSPKTQQQVETHTRPEQFESLPQGGKIQNGDTGNHQDIPPTRGVGHLDRFQGRLLPHCNTGTVQEVLEISCPGPDLPVQSTSFRFVNSSLGVHCDSKRGETDGYTQGYKDPPIPRRLVGESHLPPALSRTYTGPSKSVPGIGVAGEHGKVRTGTEASFQLCRLPVPLRVRLGPTHTGPVAKPSGKNTITSIPTGLSGPGVHVLDRSVNSHRKAGSPRPTAHEAHSVAPQKQLEDTGIPRKDDSTTQVPAPILTMVANRRQCSHRLTITPNKTCSADIYRRIKRRVGRSLKRTHCQRNLVPPGKQAAYKLPRTQGSFSSHKRVSRPLHKQDGSSSNRQHYSSVLHK